jgi:hypothetical protein
MVASIEMRSYIRGACRLKFSNGTSASTGIRNVVENSDGLDAETEFISIFESDQVDFVGGAPSQTWPKAVTFSL